MRRLALMAAIAVALPASARAQACLGSVSFGVIPVRLGGGAFFGKDYTGYAMSLVAGKDNAAFGDVGVSRTYFDDYDDTDDELFAEVGWQRAVGTRAQLCPVVGVSFGTGPNGDGFEVKSRVGSAGAALGMTLQPRPSVKLIPNGTVQLEYGAVDVTDEVTGKQTYSDTFGVARSRTRDHAVPRSAFDRADRAVPVRFRRQFGVVRDLVQRGDRAEALEISEISRSGSPTRTPSRVRRFLIPNGSRASTGSWNVSITFGSSGFALFT